MIPIQFKGGVLIITKEDKVNEEQKPHDPTFINMFMKGPKSILILWLISNESMHGYKILSIINEICSPVPGEKKVPSSIVYPMLHNLEKDNLIISHQELNGNHKVKKYEITEEGLKRLQEIKLSVQNNPGRDIMNSFIDDMFFNDKDFTQTGGSK